MFGRDLIEQVRVDARGGDRLVPIIVEKCILAVEALGKASTYLVEFFDNYSVIQPWIMRGSTARREVPRNPR
jgi:hypothetical protein